MIISTSHKFIFVHVPKTAGWSMMDTLRPFSRPEKRTLLRSLSRRLPFRESVAQAHFRVHETAAAMAAKLGRDVWDQYFSFAVVRNPFDHAVSHYEYLKQHRSESVARRFRTMSFREYLDDRLKRPFLKHTIFVRMPDQAHFLVDARGGIAVDKVLRFEALRMEWPKLTEEIGLQGTELLYVNKTKAKSADRKLGSYYDDATFSLVKRIYHRDFDLFGYSRDLPEHLAHT